MKVKLLSFAIVLICLCSVLFAGVLSVYRSEGKVISDEMAAQIEAYIQQFEEK